MGLTQIIYNNTSSSLNIMLQSESAIKQLHHNRSQQLFRENRDSSASSKGSGKLIRRKPDGKNMAFGRDFAKKKLMHSPTAEERNQSILHSEYFMPRHILASTIKKENEAICTLDKLETGRGIRFVSTKELSSLKEVKSEKNLGGMKSAEESYLHRATSVTSDIKTVIQQFNGVLSDHNHYPSQKQVKMVREDCSPSKKSRTEFFSYEACHIQQKQREIDQLSINSRKIQVEATLQEKYNQLAGEWASHKKNNSFLQGEIENLQERIYLLETQNKHLIELIFEKDKIIEKMLKCPKATPNLKKTTSMAKEIEKLNENNYALRQEILRITQQNSILRNQIDRLTQNESDCKIEISNLYAQLEAEKINFQKEYCTSSKKIEELQSEAKLKLTPPPHEQLDSFGLICRYEKVKEENKYLQIQTRALQRCKDEMVRLDREEKKVREERDYFKKKVMENIKKNSKKQLDLSKSSLFELSIDS